MADYKLTYFNIRGLAEPSRFLLKYGGIKFVDERLEKDDWATKKANYPFGQLPILTVNGKTYNQSTAIERFLARKVKLAGKDDFEDMEIDSIVDTINDLRLKLGSWFRETDEKSKAAQKETIVKETLPFYLGRLDKIAKENNGHLACKRLTWADLHFTAMCETMNFFFGSDDIFANTANLQAVIKNVKDLPAIKAWLESRPKTDF